MNKIMYILFLMLLTQAFVYADIKLEGSSTILPIIKDIKKIYKTQKLLVKGGGSEVGLSSLIKGTCDIAMLSRSLTKEEKASGLVEHTIAYDGIAIIVNASNKLDGLNSKDIIEIYSGKVNNWHKYSQYDETITVIGKSKGRATLKVFAKYFKLKNMRKDTIVVGSNMEDIIFVSSQPSAIGYVSIGAAVNTKNRGSSIHLLDLDGVAATMENVSNQKYPIVRALNLITYKKISQDVARFISFVKAAKGQKSVKKRNFIGI